MLRPGERDSLPAVTDTSAGPLWFMRDEADRANWLRMHRRGADRCGTGKREKVNLMVGPK